MTIMEDAVTACADLVGRAGASGFEIGYLRDGVPADLAGWYAFASYQGVRIITDEHKSPTLAAIALAERMLRGAACRCSRPVVLTDEAEGCRWRLMGERWEPGCDAPSVRVAGKPGDYTAMNRAMRRASARRRRRRAGERGPS